MKKIFVLLIYFMPLYLFAAPWGALSNYFEPQSVQTKAQRPGELFLLPQILDSRPVNISLFIKEEKASAKRADYEKIIAESYAQWFKGTAQIIRRSGREKEFSDILSLLDRGVSIKFDSSRSDMDKIDIVFFIWPLRDIQSVCGRKTEGCYRPKEEAGDLPAVFIPQNNFIQRIMGGIGATALHEIGHSLGMSDQYKSGRSINSHPVYSTEESRKSIMNQSEKLTCDDADGMINLIDLTLGIKRGGMSGWHSLCKDSDIVYVHGAPVTKGPYAIIPLGNKWRLDVFQNGRKTEEKIFPLDLQGELDPLAQRQETILRRDKAGRPIFARGSKGEDIYYSYSYDRRDRLVVQGGKTVQAEVFMLSYMPKKTFLLVEPRRAENLFKYFGENGFVSAVGYIRPFRKKGKKGVAVYQRGVCDKEPAVSIELEFNRKGQIVQRKVTGSALKTAQGNISIPEPVSALFFHEKGNKQPLASMEQKFSESLDAALQSKIIYQQEERLKEWYLKQP